MLTRIVVPLDGSVLGERALPYATAIARAAGARLILLHATTAREIKMPATFDVEAVAARVGDASLAVETRTVEVHDDAVGEAVGRAICEVGRDLGADLIAMSTHGRGGLERWVYGSSADIVFRQASAPVLLISATCEHRWPAERHLRVLVPLDGSALSEGVLGPATEIAKVLAADLLLTRIVEPHRGGEHEAERADASRYLQSISDRLQVPIRSVDTLAVVGHPSSAIADITRDRQVDLVAMATHGHGGLARLALGSMATRILQRVGVPLLLVRPAALK